MIRGGSPSGEQRSPGGGKGKKNPNHSFLTCGEKQLPGRTGLLAMKWGMVGLDNRGGPARECSEERKKLQIT